jgi:RimJ/RimL family protein N-acetyltransferase
MNIAPVVLAGLHIRLEPLSLEHHAAFCEIGLDDDIWRWFPTPVHSSEDMLEYIRTGLQWQAEGTALPFTTIEQGSGRIIGSTRYMNIDHPNRKVEIGSTWLGQRWQRTAANTEAKYLMLRHAFEQLGCIRVELKTDVLNQKSRNAILRIGAKEEGIFRNHIICAGGRIRDSVWYSILDSEWPEIKLAFEQKMWSASAHTPDRL